MREPGRRSGPGGGLDEATFDGAATRGRAGRRVAGRRYGRCPRGGPPAGHAVVALASAAPDAGASGSAAGGARGRRPQRRRDSQAEMAARPARVERPPIAATQPCRWRDPVGAANAGGHHTRGPAAAHRRGAASVAPSVRRRSRTGASAAPVEQGTRVPPIETAPVIDIDALNDRAAMGTGPDAVARGHPRARRPRPDGAGPRQEH